MRKIKTMADVERVRKRNNIILGVVMIALLVGSSLGYSLMSADGSEEDVVSEDGFDFVRDGGLWKLVLDGHDSGEPAIGGDIFEFQYLPSEVEDVDVNLSIELGMYFGQPLYFINPGEGAGEILRNIGGYILRYQEACPGLEVRGQMSEVEDLGNVSLGDNVSVGEVACGVDLPAKDCDSNLIIFEIGNETRIYSEKNCVFIVGDVLRGSDAFLYRILGVTK